MAKLLFILLVINSTFCMAQTDNSTRSSSEEEVKLCFLHTSDVHGAVFSFDYFKMKQSQSGLPYIYAIVDSLRQKMGEALILTDGGDCLQGQPTAYYYNYIDTTSRHLVAEVMNLMKYDCSVIGNHDIEAGHDVYDRWIHDLDMPVLGANVIDTRTNKPYLTPYHILNRCGIKIALLGLTTPTIPYWLPQNLWSNLRFEDMESSARYWVTKIQSDESPDLIVGVFHSGYEGGISEGAYQENAVKQIASNVPGFDFILYGHDHHAAVHEVNNTDGGKVICVGTSSDATCYGRVEITLHKSGAQIACKSIKASVPTVSGANAHNELAAQFLEAEFVDQRLALRQWVGQPIGTLTQKLDGMDAYFGPSLFIDFIHQLQFELTHADISFAAPLSYNSVIQAGKLSVSDMFWLYKYENFLYTMRLTGREIKGLLEMSFGLWTNQMHSADDHIMLISKNTDGSAFFSNLTFNFESAAGIIYEVDVTKPVGQRIHIISMADGTPFNLDKEYVCALNSYRGNGGGELLTRGAGIPREELSKRIITSTTKDLRYLMMQYIQSHEPITPEPLNHWRFVPTEWTEKACQRDRELLCK